MDTLMHKGKITSHNQFYDAQIFADWLSQAEYADAEKIKLLNRMILEYEQKISSAGKKQKNKIS